MLRRRQAHLERTIQPTVGVKAGDEAPALLAPGPLATAHRRLQQARRSFAALLEAEPDPAHAAEARYRMAQCYLRDEAYAEAWATLAELLETAPAADPYRAPAQFLLGEALAALANWPAAEAAYTAYLPLAPELAYLTQQRIAAARPGAGQPGRRGRGIPGRAGRLARLEQHRPRSAAAWPTWRWSRPTSQEAVAQYDALRGQETTRRVGSGNAVPGGQRPGAARATAGPGRRSSWRRCTATDHSDPDPHAGRGAGPLAGRGRRR